MAFPFKTGGDFYNCEALNMRLHNHSADLNEYGTGTIYFNTGSNTNHSKHAVVHDGTDFKALAFVDEIATNTAFTELDKRVQTIEKALGEDTADVIDTWEEIQNFLKDINANDANLMTMLDDKLSKSQGGILMSNIMLGKADIGITDGYGYKVLGIGSDGVNFLLGSPQYQTKIRTKTDIIASIAYTDYKILHSGNYSDYALPLSGGTLTQTKNATSLLFVNTTADPYISFQKGNSVVGHIKMLADSVVYVKQSDGSFNTLLHSGNYSDYALPKSGGTISGSKRDLLYLQTTDSLGAYIVFKNNNTNTAFIGYDKTAGAFFETSNEHLFLRNSNAYFKAGSTEYPLLHSGNIGEYKAGGLAHSNGTVGAVVNASGNVTIGDSDAAGSDVKLCVEDKRESNSYLLNAKFLSPNLLSGGTSIILFGKSESTKNRAYIGYTHNSDGSDNNAIIFGFYGKDKIVNFLANGNVLIGTTTDNGAKLQVSGDVRLDGQTRINGSMRFYGKTNLSSDMYINNQSVGGLNFTRSDGDSRFFIGNNVGIGTTSPTEKLHVKGNIYVEGNIIATGEVSAGGAGQEGESGAGGAEVISQPIPSGVTTYTITNTIGRSAVAVSLYEANVINGQTIWSLCLADIEVTDSQITVTFGSATSVNHKLVAVG